MSEEYNKRTWLNAADDSSTGSIVIFDGVPNWSKEGERTAFVELSDCHCKVRIHKGRFEEDADRAFRRKVIKLRDELNEYLDYLDKK